jgi:hypothetical protein
MDKYPSEGNEFTKIQSLISNCYNIVTSGTTPSGIQQELSGFFNSEYKISGAVYYYKIENNALLPTAEDTTAGFKCYVTKKNNIINSYLGMFKTVDAAKAVNSGAVDAEISAVVEFLQPKLTKKYDQVTGLVNLDTDANITGNLISTSISKIENLSGTYTIGAETEDGKQYITASINTGKFIASKAEIIRKDVINRFLQFKSYVNNKSFTSLITDDYKFNGIPLSAINIPISAIENFHEELSTATTNAQNVLTATLKDISGYTRETIDKAQYEAALKFARIFNSPAFYDTSSLYDEEGYHEATQALIDSKVIAKSNMGYKNIIMLDSKEITISNDQYDDLVTQSKFTDGDNITNDDCKNDINRRFRSDIRSANFIIIDKHKSIAAGEGSNEGIFAVIIDPYDGMKAQRLLYHNYSDEEFINNKDPKTIDYYLTQN